MTLRFTAAAVLLLMASGCGGDAPATADVKVGTTNAATTHAGTSDGATVTGKLASSLAPPSALIVLEPQGAADLPVKAEPAIMDQAGYEFLPGFLLALPWTAASTSARQAGPVQPDDLCGTHASGAVG